jgi:hypothetical protein
VALPSLERALVRKDLDENRGGSGVVAIDVDASAACPGYSSRPPPYCPTLRSRRIALGIARLGARPAGSVRRT